VRLPIQVTQIGASTVERSGETLDISSAGVLFESLTELHPGDRIEYVITLVANVPEVKLRCLGKVLRSDKHVDSESRFDTAVTIDRYHFLRPARLESVSAAI
jgi:hypothetical protein